VILYFLLFDPAAPKARDPRPSLPTTWFAPGLKQYLARTSWKPEATWFDYNLAWQSIDHQHADANQFEFYRRGEWLTKERTGYGANIACSDYHNTLAVENDRPYHAKDAGDYRGIIWRRGSQYADGLNDGDPTLVASSSGDRYLYASGDATTLYNSKYESVGDVKHVSRSIVWLKPDHIVVYDRATTKSDKRFKRFWLQLPGRAIVTGKRAVMRTPRGQQLAVTTLLPADAAVTVEPAEPLKEQSEPADLDPILARLRVESPARPADVRFLHVLQGADAKAPLDGATLIESRSDSTLFQGAAFRGMVVWFARDLGAPVSQLQYAAPAGTRVHLVTGLAPSTEYEVTVEGGNVRIRPGKGRRTDAGGVLYWEATR
jgi:hypothetical protein